MIKLSDNMRGAVLMSIAMVAFTINDTCIKILGEKLALSQIIAMRGVVVTMAMVALAAHQGHLRFDLPCREWKLISLRSFAELAAALLFLPALFKMSIANASAIMQSLPLAVTLGGALFFKEAVGWKRMIAIVIGFIGVMMIIQPGGEDFNIYSLLVVATVITVAVRDLCSRQLDRSTPSLLAATAGAAAVAVFGLIMLPFYEIKALSLADVFLLATSCASVIVGYVLAVSAMRMGEIAIVAPFRYVSLIAALIVGVLVFGRTPNGLALCGAGVVVATGLFTLYREHKLRQRIAAKTLPH